LTVAGPRSRQIVLGFLQDEIDGTLASVRCDGSVFLGEEGHFEIPNPLSYQAVCTWLQLDLAIFRIILISIAA